MRPAATAVSQHSRDTPPDTASGRATGEKLWRMPLGEAYDKQIRSDIADMKNIGGRGAGSQGPGRRQPHEQGLNRVHILDQPRRGFARGQGQGAAGRRRSQGVEQLRTQPRQGLQRRLMAGDPLDIAGAGPQDRQQTDGGAGHHIVEGLDRRRSGDLLGGRHVERHGLERKPPGALDVRRHPLLG